MMKRGGFLKYVIIGGDERSPYLYRMLKAEGNDVCCYALENAALPTSALCDGDVYVLPLPIERGGSLNAPFSDEKYTLSEIFDALPKNAVLFGGAPSGTARDAAKAKGLRLYDLMCDERFTVGNAAITAEAAVRLLMDATPRTLAEQRILVIGGGRIGTLLCAKLKALGVEVALKSGESEKRELARAMGIAAYDAPESFDAVVNTAPAAVLSGIEQKALKADCVLLELASKSGFDSELTAHCRHINGAGLPAKYAPYSAAKLIFDALKKEDYYD